jgi:hypothetical protein
MTRSKSLSFLLVSLLPFGVLAPACSSSHESTKGQMIECTTDPGTGVILRCEPGDGTGGANTCVDVDENGDGEPGDGADSGDGPVIDLVGRAHDGGGGGGDDGEAGDDDGDGVPDSEDCDHHPGEDDDGDDGDVDLPYDVRPGLGDTTAPIADAFDEKGAQPAAVVSVTGATWRLAELQAGTAFVVTADDCSHAGNRDTGRDRVIVTWKNVDGSVHADHLDIRYCD